MIMEFVEACVPPPSPLNNLQGFNPASPDQLSMPDVLQAIRRLVWISCEYDVLCFAPFPGMEGFLTKARHAARCFVENVVKGLPNIFSSNVAG